MEMKMQTAATGGSQSKLDWRSIVDRVSQELEWFEEQGIKPTLRTLFYRLVSLEVIPNTKDGYVYLSNRLVAVRKKRELPCDCIGDEGRESLADFEETYRTPEQYIQAGIDWLKNASQHYKNSIPRW
jgi:hypothetical protein